MYYEINQDDLDRLEKSLNGLEGGLKKAFDGFVAELKARWKSGIPRRSGAYAAALNFEPSAADFHGGFVSAAKAREFILGENSPEVGYSLINEMGRADADYDGTPAALAALNFCHRADLFEKLTRDEFDELMG